MASFLDYYTRLKLSCGRQVRVIYYQDCVKKEMIGVLYKTLGSDRIIVFADGENEISIPFFRDGYIIKSIRLHGDNDYIVGDVHDLFINPYDLSCISSDNVEIRTIIFGEHINYECQLEKSIERDYYDNIAAIKYYNIFSSECQRQLFFEFLEKIIYQLTLYCTKNGLDVNLNFCGLGTTSIVYSIGNKVVKFGGRRRYSRIPYCEFLLQPIINDCSEFDGADIHVEVNQKVKKSSKETLYRALSYLKEKLSEIGLHLTDDKIFNIGLLESSQDNKIKYDDIFYNTANDRATSIAYNSNLHIEHGLYSNDFDGGFPVILDLDDVYIEDIDKYTIYLRRIGFKEEIIQSVIDDYNNGLFDTSNPPVR